MLEVLINVLKKLAGNKQSHRSQSGADVISSNAHSGWKLVSFTLFGEKGPNLPFRDKYAQPGFSVFDTNFVFINVLSVRYGRKLTERDLQMNMDLDGEEAEQLAGRLGG